MDTHDYMTEQGENVIEFATHNLKYYSHGSILKFL